MLDLIEDRAGPLPRAFRHGRVAKPGGSITKGRKHGAGGRSSTVRLWTMDQVDPARHLDSPALRAGSIGGKARRRTEERYRSMATRQGRIDAGGRSAEELPAQGRL